ncbi:Uncharacterized protein TCM_015824 [Theobroma cacao]|uniref:Uncharacterized protein n=1 Tax=Theobroma cacao TaxID=3641 RepID=A0A061G2U3_THECC|nr:Uncharacterized protein TCM_015824 [Theobroma cacao]
MVLHVDLRYVLPPFMNLLFFLLQTNPDKPWSPMAIAELVLDSPYLVLNLILSLFALFLLLFFFYVSFQLPVTVTFGPLLLRAQDFSIALLLSVVAAFLLQPSLFWLFFLLVIITYL